MARCQYNSNFFGSVAVLKKHLVKLPKHVCAGVHRRADVQVLKFLNGLDQRILKLDVVVSVGRRKNADKRCKFWLAVLSENRVAPAVDLANENRQFGL